MHKQAPGQERQRRRFVQVLLCLTVAAGAATSVHTSAAQALEAQVAVPLQQGKEKAETVEPSSRPPQTNTQGFHLSRERYEKAVAYSRAGYVVYFVSVAWEILALLLLLKTRLAAKWRDFAEAASGNWMVQGLIFVPLLSLALGVAQLPLSLYWHRLSLRYEQSVQGWGSWLWDWTKGELISTVFGIIGALLLFAVIRKAPTRWWLYFWFVSIPLVLFLVLITPLVLDPMFHTFVPLQDKNPQLVQLIVKLSQRAGEPIPPNRMFLMEASEKTNQINAYVTGIGASKRVVIWDNTINKMSPDEVLFIVGHEMGHYVLGHVVKGIVFALAGIFIALFIAYHALRYMLERWGGAWNIHGQQDWAALVVLLLIASILGFLGEPIGNSFSRSIEHAADVYGLEVTHSILPNARETAAHSFQVMGDLDLADPDPPRFIAWWLYSHPPLEDRLKFAHNYDPWDNGQPPKYVK